MGKIIEVFDDSLLGGAAMSIDDLEVVESQEIRWLFVSQDGDSEKSQKLT